MDSEPPQIGAPISVNAPQRPLRIGRGDKYYEVLYVGGVAQERRLGRRTTQDEARNSLILDSQRQEHREEYPVLDAQDPPASELNPQPSVRRRRSRQGLAVQPTPPLRRHRPGSIRSKESTPSLDSSETSFSEEVVRETSAQPSLYALPEQDSDVYSDNAAPTVETPRIPSKSAIPIYDKPRHIYLTPEQEPLTKTMDSAKSIPTDDENRAQQQPVTKQEQIFSANPVKEPDLRSLTVQHAGERRQEDVSGSRDADYHSQRQQQEEWQRKLQTEQYQQQQEQLALQNRVALQRLQQDELLERQRLESEKQQQLEIQRQQHLELLKEEEAKILRQQQAELQRQQQAELQRQQQAELQRQQQVELQRQQQAELQRQQQLELQRQQQAELQRQLQVELQRQQQAELRKQQEEELQKRQQQQELERLQQAELQRQQQAELQKQQELEMLRQQQAALQKQQQELQQQAELRARQAAGRQGQQRALEPKDTETLLAQTNEQSQNQPLAKLSRKPSQKSSQAREERTETSNLSTPSVRSLHPDSVDVTLSGKPMMGGNSSRGEGSRSPQPARNLVLETEKATPGAMSSRPEQVSGGSEYQRRTSSQGDDHRGDSEVRAVLGNDAIAIDGSFVMQDKNAAPTKAPVGHRDTPNEPTLGTTSPESLLDWYENDENFLMGADDDDLSEGAVKRMPSKIIRKIKGLFENKKGDDTPSSTSTERKRSDQLEPPPSPREPTTPTKKSKLGQFFSFNKKDERRKASPPPPLIYAPACQGPEEIPDGMLAKVFRSKCTQGKVAEQPTTPKTAPPFPNFREWSPSTEDLSKVGTGKEKEFTKPSKYFVPKIPPFQSRGETPQAERALSAIGAPERQLGDDLLAPEVPEARNSPYSLCRNRGSVKSSTPRRTSLAEDDVDEMYEQLFEQERSGLLQNPTKPVEETPGHTFVRKPSKKAAAIPPELRAPIYQPNKDEPPMNHKQNMDDSETRRAQTSPPPREQVPPESPGSTQLIEIEEILIEEEIIEEPNTLPDNRNSIQELRPLFKQAWMLIDFMTQDLIDGVPKEAWGELRIFFLIMIGMLVMLYVQGILRFTGENPLAFLRTLFRGFQIFLGSAIQAGMAIHDAVDAMLTDASSKLVADTLKEI